MAGARANRDEGGAAGFHPSGLVAKRWAVKEAAAKALGVGIGAQARFTDFQVVHNDRGAPKLQVSGHAATTAGGDARWHVSITDDGGFAQAFVIWESPQVG